MLTFDSFLTVTNTSIPWETQNGNTYTFTLGDLGVNECDQIHVDLSVSCDAVLGQTFCSEAHIYPDTFCIPPPNLWDGSSLELIAHCEDDSVPQNGVTTMHLTSPVSAPMAHACAPQARAQRALHNNKHKLQGLRRKTVLQLHRSDTDSSNVTTRACTAGGDCCCCACTCCRGCCCGC